jgi:AcrR family transcriptional regulator
VASRAYLRPEDRRRQLLDAAARLFERGGFAAITVSAVAAEAGASRRLVYDHFADLGALDAAFFEDRVARYARTIDDASAPGTSSGTRSLGGALRVLLAIPPEDLRAIHLVLADRATPELAGARAALGNHLQARWLPLLASSGLPAEVARAALWMVASSFVTLAELVQRQELSPEAAEALALGLVAPLPEIAGNLIARPPLASEPT